MNGPGAYLDASAFVKLVVDEPESEALESRLRSWPARTSSALLRTEARRAVRHLDSAAMERAVTALRGVRLIDVRANILDSAGLIDPTVLRSLDAIHLATAQALGGDVAVVFTYDHQMRRGGELLGLPVESPA
ncbi:MAG: type II toxin-antitoxin system VapC family toxin [Acidimicrobiia bacterium]